MTQVSVLFSGLVPTYPGWHKRIAQPLFFLAIFSLCIISGCNGIVSASEPTIVITSYEVQPEVVMPGGTALITATVTNTAQKAMLTTTSASGTAQSVTETRDINAYISDVLLFGNGIQVESGDYRRVGEIGPGQSIALTFLVKAPENTGIYFPELHIATQGGRSLKYPIPVNVNDDRLVQRNPALEIEKDFPSEVIPGETAGGRIVLKNSGETAASEIFLNLTCPGKEISLTSSGSAHISRLGPGEEAPVGISIITSREATEGIHPIQCLIRYSSAAGKAREQAEEIPVRICGKPELSIAAVTTDPVRVQEGSPFSLIVRIENTGTGDADGVKAGIYTGITGTNDAFVGRIEPDNDAPAVFYLQRAQAGDHTIPVSVFTRNGTPALNDEVEITIAARSEPPVIPVLVILGVVAVGFLLWRRNRST